MNRLKLFVLDDYEGVLAHAPAMERMRQLADVTIFDRPLAPSDSARLKECHVIFALRERTQLDESFFNACENLELVLQTGGHAYHVDQNAATQRGVAVALGRRVTKSAVVMPELTFGLILGLIRQIYPLNADMAKGNWSLAMGGSLAGRTLGILGYGRLGRPTARIAQAFGMKVIAWDRTGAGGVDEFGVRRLPLEQLLAESDVVSIHLKLSDESRNLLNRERIGKMKPGAILINTSRGQIVDEAALINALREKRLAGAGLDVFAVEPLPAFSPLRTLPNVLLTPHIGWKVTDVLEEFVAVGADQLQAWLNHQLDSGDIMNPQALAVQQERIRGVKAIHS